jgi:LCP family protein required for cell wall assembly
MRNNNWDIAQSHVNLVSARSHSAVDAKKLSRNGSADGYAQLRKKRARKKTIIMGLSIALVSLLAAIVVAATVWVLWLNGELGRDLLGNQANFDSGVYEGLFVEPEKPEDPFWILLMGTDDREGYEVPRTDTLILARVDQKNKRASLISIPRDLYVEIPGYGYNKINAAYTFAELEEPGSGAALTIKTVQNLAGVQISYFAQINFTGLENLVDGLGGVEVDVPVDIVNDPDSGGLDIYAGVQTLDGAHALTFCRARNSFDQGDYQRQANQRTFLQALAKQVLASDPPTIANTVSNMATMTFTNMDVAKLVKIAQGMQGMEESGIYTYHLPASSDSVYIGEDKLSVEILDSYAWQELITALDAGEYPELQDDPRAGVVPDSYLPSSTPGAVDQTAGGASSIDASQYLVDVRNGCGIQGSATSVSDMLALAGYQRGEIGNANAYVYDETLIIYQDETSKAAAEDIRRRLGYGKTIASLGRYSFTGNILVVVGNDFPA